MKYDLLIWKYAIKRGVDPVLIKAIMDWESGFNTFQVTPESKGRFSYGLMQILDQTARGVFGITDYNILLNPDNNLFYSTKLLKDLKNRYPDNIQHQMAGYNAGSAKFNEFGDYINQRYVNEVSKRYRKYKGRLYAWLGFPAAGLFGVVLLKEN